MGYEVRKIKIPSLEMVIPAYYTIATAEASANLARYCGVRYGLASMGADNPDVLMRRSRHDGFGSEVKLRILLWDLCPAFRFPRTILYQGAEGEDSYSPAT